VSARTANALTAVQDGARGDNNDSDSEPGRRAHPVSGNFKLAMSEFLFLFGRRPSDARWLESADRLETLTLLGYFARRARRDRGAA
jgi:hypothetical protein